MSLSLTQSKSALAVDLTASFLGVGGVSPYTYEVLSGGAGGTINALSGLYTAPAVVPEDPKKFFDTIRVTDSAAATAEAQIMVGTPLMLLCDIIQKELGLAQGRVFLWDQKVFQPHDNGLYVIVGVSTCKPFGNVNSPVIVNGVPDWSQAEQYVAMMATCELDIISRGPAARDRKEEVLLALNSFYAESQQEANSFHIGRIPPGARFLNLSVIDGAAIPYRFRISVNMQYAVKKAKSIDYFSEFRKVQVTTNP